MTWEELIEKVKDIKDIEIKDLIQLSPMKSKYIYLNGLYFYENGDVYAEGRVYLTRDRTPDQMYQIIKALTDKEL